MRKTFGKAGIECSSDSIRSENIKTQKTFSLFEVRREVKHFSSFKRNCDNFYLRMFPHNCEKIVH